MNIDAILAHDHQVFTANGLFDPDITGTGHQPRGFDQFMALYDKYVVVSSSITLKARNSLNRRMSILGIRISESPTDYDATNTGIVEKKGGIFRFVRPMEAGSITMKQAFNTKKWFRYRGDLGAETDDAGDFQALATANPTKQAYFQITSARCQGTDNNPVNLVGWIDYRVMLVNPKKIGAS